MNNFRALEQAATTTLLLPERHRIFKPLWIVAVAVCIGLLSLGCFTTSPRMHNFAHDIERDLPDLDLDHQFGLTLGRMSLGLIKGVAKWGMDEDDDDTFTVFRGIKKVELATFEAHGTVNGEFPKRLQKSLEHQGWETLARFRDDGELGWVGYRLEKKKLKNVMVMMLDEEELTLVRLSGRLDKVLRAALTYSNDEIFDGPDHHDAEHQGFVVSQNAPLKPTATLEAAELH